MKNPGDLFKRAIIREILLWKLPDLNIYAEVFVGSRFIGQKRKLDIVLEYKNKTIGLELKTQQSSGTAYEKLPYAIEDAKRCPIPTFIVFSGKEVKDDIRALLISSGIGIEIEWDPINGFGFGLDILKQRIKIELGMNWLDDQKDCKINPADFFYNDFQERDLFRSP